MKKSILALLAVGLLCGLTSQQLQATPLPPGGAVAPAIGFVDPMATAVCSMVGAFASGDIQGTVESWVFSGDTFNPFGGLTFVYRINSAPTSTDTISSLGISGFAGLLADVVQDPAGGAFASAIADRSLDGNTIGWNFLGGGRIPAGASSFYLIVRTDGTTYHTGTAGVSDGTGATASPVCLPGAVPDGGSAVALLGIGLAGIEGLRRRLQARKA